MDCTSPVFGKYPCGKCINCRARIRQEWVFRLRMEYQSCNFGLFVTLTYADEYLPPDGVSISDIQKFLKRLRKYFASKTLRYFIVSEYGDHTFRSHYHALLFFKCERSTDIYDKITKAWQLGFVQFGEIEEGSIVYCTKYCLKGSDVPLGKNKNFLMLSKMNGGIGVNHVYELEDFYTRNLDKPQIVTSGEYVSPMPRYYRTKLLNQLDETDKELIKIMYLENLQEMRQKAIDKKKKLFRKQHPGFNPDERYIDNIDYTRFDYWNSLRNERKEEAVTNRTKKQNLL